MSEESGHLPLFAPRGIAARGAAIRLPTPCASRPSSACPRPENRATGHKRTTRTEMH